MKDLLSRCYYSVKARLSLLLLAIMGLCMLLKDTDLVKQFEYFSIDARFKLRSNWDTAAHDSILLVGISESCLSLYGRWPWDRSVHGHLMKAFSHHEPKVVTFDLIFTEGSELGGGVESEVDLYMAQSAEYLPFVVTGAFSDKGDQSGRKAVPVDELGYTQPLINVFGDKSLVYGSEVSLVPYPALRDASYFGFVNSDPDSVDGIRRMLPLVFRQGTDLYPSLALQTLIGYFDVYVDDVNVYLGDRVEIIRDGAENIVIPVNERGEIWINWRDKNIFKSQRYSAFLQSYDRLNNDNVPLPDTIPQITDKILLVGQIATGLTDLGPTPLDPVSPLFLVHANVLNSILQGDYVRTMPLWIFALFWILITWGQFILLWDKDALLAASIPFATLVIYIFLAFTCFVLWDLMLPMAWPILGFLIVNTYLSIHNWIKEAKHKGEIKMMFGTYLSPDIVDDLIDSDQPPTLGGHDEEITTFFSDVQNFSTFSEVLSAHDLVILMTEYLSDMTDVLLDHGGTLDKFYGDAIVGFFGAPKRMDDHAYQACAAALKMQFTQFMLREKWKNSENQKWPMLVRHMQTRIGLCTGEAIVGNIGSKNRFNYTMMGDTVNLGARCESSAKSYGVYIMVSESTKQSVEEIKDDMAFRFLDMIVVKGRSQPVKIYELVGFKKDLSSDMDICLELFQAGHVAYFNQDWDAAMTIFEQSADYEYYKPGKIPGVTSNPSLVFWQRCREMKEAPPGKDWDGIYVMKTK